VHRVSYLLVLVGCGRLAFDPIELEPPGDGAPGALNIEGPEANAEVGPTTTVFGACQSGIDVEVSGAGLFTPASAPCGSDGHFEVFIAFTAGFGSKAITLAQNTSSVSRTFVRVPQEVVQLSATSGSTVSAGDTIDCDLVIPRPPSVSDGTFLIGMIYTDGGTPAAIDIATAGFTALSLAGTTFVAFHKIANNEPAQYAFRITAGMFAGDTCASAGVLVAFKNVDPEDPIDSQSQNVNFAATIVAPEVVASHPTLLVAFFGANGGGRIGKPTPMIIADDPMPNGSFGSSAGGFAEALISWQETPATLPNSTGPRTATVTGSVANAGGMVALRPN
jgi:hypothetical protein